MAQPPDYSDPLYGVSDLPRRPAVASAPVTGGFAPPEPEQRPRAYPGKTYGHGPGEAPYPDQPDPNAPWPLVSGTPPRPRNRLLRAALTVIVILVVAGAAVGAWLVIGRPSQRGTDVPEQAVEGFLGALFQNHDGRAAARYVCERARDQAALDQLAFRVKQNEESYTAALTTWSYPPITTAGRQASADVTITMTTANEQSSRREVTLLLVDDRGWFVCDVTTG